MPSSFPPSRFGFILLGSSKTQLPRRSVEQVEALPGAIEPPAMGRTVLEEYDRELLRKGREASRLTKDPLCEYEANELFKCWRKMGAKGLDSDDEYARGQCDQAEKMMWQCMMNLKNRPQFTNTIRYHLARLSRMARKGRTLG